MLLRIPSLSLASAALILGFVSERAFAAPTVETSRAIILAPESGASPQDVEIREAQNQVRPADAKAESYDRLAWAFVAKARRTLDAGYYKLAETTEALRETSFGSDAESRLVRGHVLHNLHRFTEAEAVAKQLVSERGTARDFALLSDALMEQGKLSEAVSACQQLVNLKPSVEAYSRVAHLRWLKGDLVGAITMMETAERAVSVRDSETRGWVLVRLSNYALQSGQTVRALALAEDAQRLVVDYPPAALARGRALLALGKTPGAVEALRIAAEQNPLPEYQWWLAEALRANGEIDAASAVEIAMRAHGEASDPRTLALFLATRAQNSDEAVRLARAELVHRADVLTHDALAWALAVSGDAAAAESEMKLALAENTRDARLLWHAGEIALLRGDRERAAKAFADAKPFAATLTPSERTRLEQRLSTGGAFAHTE